MYTEPLSRRLLSEGLGSALLAATVVGSGIMAQRLAGGNAAIALLANTAATVAVLYTLITLFGDISGAHFNPAVSLIEALRGRLSWRDAGAYAVIQIAGCCAGTILAHLMFELPMWQLSTHVRSGPAQWLAEAIATFGLLLVIIGHRRAEEAPWMVPGIRPIDAPAFIGAELIGAITALGVSRLLYSAAKPAAVSLGFETLTSPTDEQRREIFHV